jgi:hypothetical protein
MNTTLAIAIGTLTAVAALIAILFAVSTTRNWIKGQFEKLRDWVRPNWESISKKFEELKLPAFSLRTKEGYGHYWVPDIMFNPITWTAFLAVIALTASIAVVWLPYSGLEWLVTESYFQYNPMSGVAFFALVGLLFVMAMFPEFDDNGKIKVFTVPGPKFGAMLTWGGIPLPAFLTTGKYPIIGRLGFDWLPGDTTKIIVDANGYVNLGDITFNIWNSADAESKHDQTIIVLPAKNKALVSASLTFIHEPVKPRLWLNAQNSGLEVGQRARQEYQEILRCINDTDATALQDMMSAWMVGKSLITCFIIKETDQHKDGSIIVDNQGLPMITYVGQYKAWETEDEAIQRFAEKLPAKANSKLWKLLDKSKGLPITVLTSSSSMTTVIEKRGYRLQNVIYGDVEFSKPVTDAANQASAEISERESQIASAITNRMVRAKQKPTSTELKNPELYQLNLALAAAADSKNGNVRVVMVPGGGMKAGLIAAAGEIGAKK